MQKTFEAVYQDGVLRPLEPLDLADEQHVQVTISAIADRNGADDLAGYFDPAEWELSKRDAIGLDEVRRALSAVSGSLSDAIIAAREERF